MGFVCFFFFSSYGPCQRCWAFQFPLRQARSPLIADQETAALRPPWSSRVGGIGNDTAGISSMNAVADLSTFPRGSVKNPSPRRRATVRRQPSVMVTIISSPKATGTSASCSAPVRSSRGQQQDHHPGSTTGWIVLSWPSHLVDHLVDLLLGLRQRRSRIHLTETDRGKVVVDRLPEAVAIVDRTDPLPVRQDVEGGLAAVAPPPESPGRSAAT